MFLTGSVRGIFIWQRDGLLSGRQQRRGGFDLTNLLAGSASSGAASEMVRAFSSKVPKGPGQNPIAATGRNLGTPRPHIHLLPEVSPAQHGDRPLVHVVNGMLESHKMRASREQLPHTRTTGTAIPASGICSAPSLISSPALAEVAAHAAALQSHQKPLGNDTGAAALVPPPLSPLLLLQMAKEDRENRPSWQHSADESPVSNPAAGLNRDSASGDRGSSAPSSPPRRGQLLVPTPGTQPLSLSGHPWRPPARHAVTLTSAGIAPRRCPATLCAQGARARPPGCPNSPSTPLAVCRHLAPLSKSRGVLSLSNLEPLSSSDSGSLADPCLEACRAFRQSEAPAES